MGWMHDTLNYFGGIRVTEHHQNDLTFAMSTTTTRISFSFVAR
jgi:1,4-alpha-glucan branching enzyme